MDRQKLPQPKPPVKRRLSRRASAVRSLERINSIWRSVSAETQTRLAPLINDPHILELVRQVITGNRDSVAIHEDIACTEREVLEIAAATQRERFTVVDSGRGPA
jgi:hypothetical protein